MAAKAFLSEVALCARFIAATADGWVSYAESSGWDILLVRKIDGFQIGIQAKLRMNTDVVNQTIEEYGSFAATRSGPDCRAVLVPNDAAGGFERIADYIGFTIIRVSAPPSPGMERFRRFEKQFRPDLPVPAGQPDYPNRSWHEWWPAARHKLPAYVPDVPAGASSPVQLTDWKIGAIKIQIIIETRGHVTRDDFKHVGIDHRRWLASDGILQQGAAHGQWLGPLAFDKQHPRAYAQIKADGAVWLPPDLKMVGAP